MHRHGIRSAEYGCGFAVLACAVGEKQRVVCREQMGEGRALAYEAVVYDGAGIDFAAGCEHESVGHDVAPDIHGVAFRRGYCAVAQAGRAFDVGVVADVYVGDCAGVYYTGVRADFSACAVEFPGMHFDYRRQAFDHLVPVTVHGYQIGGLCRQPFVDRHFASACLVEHRHFGADAECTVERGHEAVYVFDVGVVCDVVVGDVGRHTAYVDVVAHRHIVQCHVGDGTFSYGSAGKIEVSVEFSEAYFA